MNGRKKGTLAKVDIKVGDLDTLFIPGGYSPDILGANEDAVKFVRILLKAAKQLV